MIQNIEKIGFVHNGTGAHMSRTIMLDDLRKVFDLVDRASGKEGYINAIVNLNILSKPTKNTRNISLQKLMALYSFDLKNPLFRCLRDLWDKDEGAQPLLAMSMALARDPLLHATKALILDKQIGEVVSKVDIQQMLISLYPDRFSEISIDSISKNINSSWTYAGYLKGKTKKIRSRPTVSPVNVVFNSFLAYAEGRTGQRIFTSDWIALFGQPLSEIELLASSASNRGLMDFLNAGGVKELRFPGRLIGEDEEIRRELESV
jgi:hypothetical protein